MARLERVRVYPIKGLDGIEVDAAELLDGGTLEHDREFALFDADAAPPDAADESPHAHGVFNAKHSDRFHRLDTDFDPETTALSVETADGERREFDLDSERDAASAWFSDYFDADLTLRRNSSVGFVDRPTLGPSVVSTATLETVASWFEEMSVESARRRLRANVEISGVPAFWEDRLVADLDSRVRFRIGDVELDGVDPCQRCVVPSRDPDTGEEYPDFRKTFVKRRRGTIPDWSGGERFDDLYRLMVNTDVPEPERGGESAVGDEVEILGTVPAPSAD